jgi:hypothetical protein
VVSVVVVPVERWHGPEMGIQSGPAEASTNAVHGIKEHFGLADETKQPPPMEGRCWGSIVR